MEFAIPPLLCSTRGLSDRVGGARAALRWCAERELLGVSLDATDPELRPRSLDRGARRELAATLKRLEQSCGGVDLLIPAEHFESPGTVDRAVTAALGAVALLSELRTLGAASADPVLCTTVGGGAGGSVSGAIAEAADREGVRIATLGRDAAGLAVGLELGVLARSGADAAARIVEAGGSLGVVRVERFDRATLSAVPAAVGAMSAASPNAVGVMDLTDCADPQRAQESCADAWRLGPA